VPVRVRPPPRRPDLDGPLHGLYMRAARWRIQRWKPWERSTGPKTPEGKAGYRATCLQYQSHVLGAGLGGFPFA
jgi:hypothetical protein